MRETGDTMTQQDDGDGRHNNGKGQHGDVWHNDGNRRQHGNKQHDNTAKRGQRVT